MRQWRFRGTSLVVAIATVLTAGSVATTRADTVTWTGGGDGVNWSHPPNWSTGQVPLEYDDVELATDDAIQMDVVSSPANPVIIKSLSVDGSDGGRLVIQHDKGLRVRGDFENDPLATQN